MPMTTATIRMDSELKAQLQTLMSELGLDMSTFFIMSAKQAVREQGIPLKITMDVPNAETLKAIHDAENGIGLSKGFISVEELTEELNADD